MGNLAVTFKHLLDDLSGKVICLSGVLLEDLLIDGVVVVGQIGLRNYGLSSVADVKAEIQRTILFDSLLKTPLALGLALSFLALLALVYQLALGFVAVGDNDENTPGRYGVAVHIGHCFFPWLEISCLLPACTLHHLGQQLVQTWPCSRRRPPLPLV